MTIRAFKSGPWMDTIGLYLGERLPDGRMKVADPLVWRLYGQHEFPQANPVIDLEYKDAQVLMDTLWDCGVRPTHGAGSAGALDATKEHLSDMQKLVFKFVEELSKP